MNLPTRRHTRWRRSLFVRGAPNALAQATQASTYASGISYFANGGMSNFTYGNGIVHTLTQNARLLPLRSKDMNGATAILDDSYAYDANTNVVSISDGTTGSSNNRSMSYDTADRLIQTNAPNQAWISSEYQYDSLDNIKLARLGTRHYNYSQNALNQLASITQPSTTPSATNYGLGSCADASLIADLGNGSTGPSVAIPNAGTAGTATTGGAQSPKYTFTTDNEGRMTAKGTQAYVYDALNRMAQVTGKESYIYDGHGRRVQITKTSDGSINYPLYSLDGKLILEDNRQTLQRIEYIHAGGRLVAKKIQPITAAGVNNGTASTTTIHTDFLGSPVAETNSAGTVSRVERYTPYGEPSDMQLDAGPGFTGHATDVATGLTYMQQRYMDAELGRFLTPDPVGPEEDFINHFNRYVYAYNNPVRYTDPDGSCPVCKIGVDFALEVGIQYATTGTVNVGSAARETIKGALNPIKTVERAKDLARIYRGSKLARSMDKAGRGVEKGTQQAHHVIAQNDKRAGPAREVLEKNKIDINDADNGARMSNSAHKSTHTNEYYQSTNDRIVNADKVGGAPEIRKEMQQITKELEKKP